MVTWRKYTETVYLKQNCYYSQIAAYQAKTDYGVDLGDQLAEKAVGELSREIDTEVVNLLVDNAKEDAEMVWSKTLPVNYLAA